MGGKSAENNKPSGGDTASQDLASFDMYLIKRIKESKITLQTIR